MAATVGHALDSGRKQVTVLFADIVESTELIRDLDPEDAQALLDGAVRVMMDAVHRYGGTISQTRGDSILALFGAPVAQEDHAVRACYAALGIQSAFRQAHATLGAVRVRVGLNSGEVVVRRLANDLGLGYSAMGQAVHLAARMEQVARPGAVMLSGATRALVEGYVQVQSLGPVEVKGLAEPVEVWELLGPGPARTRLDAAAARGLTRFVGRQQEVAALDRALGLAAGGNGQVVALVGEPAVGKSRIVWELTHSERVREWQVLATGAVSYGLATTYLPIAELLRRYFGIERRDDPPTIRERVAETLARLGDAVGDGLGSAMRALLALLDVSVEDATWAALDPTERRRQTLDAVKRLLLAESTVQPLLLVVEDLHWCDGETLALLDSLVAELPSARLLLVVNYRPEYRHAWGGLSQYRELQIGPLPAESADELLDELLGTSSALGPLKQRLIEQTEANPLFLEESVRALVETAALIGERGARQLARPVEQLTIPATVQAILAARIDRLTPGARRLLQAAAVLGKDVPYPLLVAIAEAPEDEVRARLVLFQDADLLYEVERFPDLKYTFKHALTHEVAYGGLLRDPRRDLHVQVVGAIERLAGERIAEEAERLAHHAVHGELWEPAVVYLRQAADRAVSRAAYREAIAHLEKALEALRQLPESDEATILAFDVRMEVRRAIQPLGDWARMGMHLREAAALARSVGDGRRLAQTNAYLVNQHLAMGEYDDALAVALESVSVGRALDDLVISVQATSVLGQTRIYRGELAEAVACYERFVVPDGDLYPARFVGGATGIGWGLAEAWHADALAQLGRFDEALVHATAGMQVGIDANHAWQEFRGMIDLGRTHLRRGDVPRAIETLESSLALSRTHQFAFGTPFAAASLAAAYGLAGRPDEALALIEEPLAALRKRNDYSRPTLVLICAVIVNLTAGRLDEAMALAQETVALARKLKAYGFLADGLRLAGEVAWLAGDDDDALGSYREALTLAEPRGMRAVEAHSHLGLGRLAWRAGHRDEACAELTAAVALLREMGMAHWLPEAESMLLAATRP